MKDRWHEQIQRCADGQLGAEEIAELHDALDADAELRALYLDYLNLDAALGAMADTAVIAANGATRATADPRQSARPPAHYWRWAAGTAAVASLATIVMFSKRHDALRAQPDLASVTTSTRAAISRLPAFLPPVLPSWMSPTASLLDQPAFPQ